MKFSHRARPLPKEEPHLRPNSRWISCRPIQPNAQAALSGAVPKQLCRRTILGDHQIRPPILVKVCDRSATLLAINFDAGLLAGHGLQPSRSITAQQQPAACVIARDFRLIGKKILAQKNVLMAVAIEISDADAERRSKLSLRGQKLHLKMVGAIQEDHRS
jgi:hypothetical protein